MSLPKNENKISPDTLRHIETILNSVPHKTDMPKYYSEAILEYIKTTEFLDPTMLSHYEEKLGFSLLKSGCPLETIGLFDIGLLATVYSRFFEFIDGSQYRNMFELLTPSRAVKVLIILHFKFENSFSEFFNPRIEWFRNGLNVRETWEEETLDARRTELENLIKLVQDNPTTPVEFFAELM